MAPPEPPSKEEMEPGLMEGEGALPLAHEKLPGGEDEAVLGPLGFRRVGREAESVQGDLATHALPTIT